jgi:hypothetical protein
MKAKTSLVSVLVLILVLLPPQVGSEASWTVCGDQVCDEGETSENCPLDCGEAGVAKLTENGAPIKAQERPRLIIEDIFFKPKIPWAGEKINFIVIFRNKGGEAYEGLVKFSLVIDGREVKVDELTDLIGAYEERQHEIGPIFLSEVGEHTLKVTLEYKVGENIFNSDSKFMVFGVGADDAVSDYVKNTNVQQPPKSYLENPLYLVIIVAVIIVIVGLLIIFIRKRDRRAEAPAMESMQYNVGQELIQLQKEKNELEDIIRVSKVQKKSYSVDNELIELQKKKDEIEEIIRIAKVKYYKRKLDEDSYKGIVKDNQEKLIQVEAKIGKIENRISRLETKSGRDD